MVDTHVDAVSAALSRRPDVIRSDVLLFEGRGPAAVAEIRAHLGHIPVIFITATPGDCGAVVHGDILLGKPLDRASLRTAFAKMLP
jgi:CheY-like chemotaxis protein